MDLNIKIIVLISSLAIAIMKLIIIISIEILDISKKELGYEFDNI